jgi:hypothetical protein
LVLACFVVPGLLVPADVPPPFAALADRLPVLVWLAAACDAPAFVAFDVLAFAECAEMPWPLDLLPGECRADLRAEAWRSCRPVSEPADTAGPTSGVIGLIPVSSLSKAAARSTRADSGTVSLAK